MQGLMQDRPLLISSLIEHAATFHPDTEIVSRLPEGPTHRTTWRGLRDRARQLAPQLKSVRAFVAMTDRAHMPAIEGLKLLCFEELLDAQSGDCVWPEFDEKSASSLCDTSGTTGNPKGVLYSHRSTVLHTLMALAPDTFGISSSETLLLIVPMFHAMPGARLMRRPWWGPSWCCRGRTWTGRASTP